MFYIPPHPLLETSSLTCNISIPERLVHDLTRLAVIWSYDLARLQRVDVINSDTTIGNVIKIGIE